MGRPKKHAPKPRKRSPFRVKVFEQRHGAMMEEPKKNIETNKCLEIQLKALNEKSRANEERLSALEESKTAENNESRKIKTRITILESKQADSTFPDSDDIPSLLEFFNLNIHCAKEEIRTAVNLRLMELNSNVSKDIHSLKKMTEDQKKH